MPFKNGVNFKGNSLLLGEQILSVIRFDLSRDGDKKHFPLTPEIIFAYIMYEIKASKIGSVIRQNMNNKTDARRAWC